MVADVRIYRYSGVFMFEHGTKGFILSIGTSVREKPLGKKAESFSSVGSAGRMRGSKPRVSRKQLAGHAGPTLE